MKLFHLDGEKFYYAFFYGRREVLKKQKHLNHINVYPVPDGDTGTNLASTMHSIIEGAKAAPSIEVVSRNMAEAALSGSRGNSGIIFAQFVQGLNESIRGKKVINTREFTQAVRNGVEYAYKSLSKPVEGTILTVMEAWSNALHVMHEKSTDFNELMQKSLRVAQKALADTPKKLKILEESGVVDAGAQGFVHFLEGVTHFLKYRKKPRQDDQMLIIDADDHVHPEITHGNIPFRYCTELLLQGKELDVEVIRHQLKDDGDSLIVAGGGSRIRVHCHTNHPWKLRAKVRSFGTVIQQKVDDMRRQYETGYARKASIALVTDSTCDLPQEILDKYQIHVVPLQIAFGGDTYIDKLTLTPDQFYDLLDSDAEFPKTSQPTVRAFETLYSYLSVHYDSIISLHLSDKLSGTCNAAQVAADRMKDTKISVIDTKQLSISLALVVKRIAREIMDGSTHEKIVQVAEEMKNRTKVFLSVKTLKYLVQGGRVSPLKGWAAKLLNLKPIVSLDDEGKTTLFDKTFGTRANIQKIIRLVKKHHQQTPIQSFVIGTVRSEKEAQKLEERLIRVIGKKADYIINVSPVIGTHVGVGGLGVAVL